MIIASGFVEVDGLHNVEKVMSELKRRGLEVNEVEEVKVTFLIERETVGAVKTELNSLKDIEDVRNVHLAYYSVEGADEGSELEGNEMGSA
jgi:nitrate reductase NapAB chaperone NapD